MLSQYFDASRHATFAYVASNAEAAARMATAQPLRYYILDDKMQFVDIDRRQLVRHRHDGSIMTNIFDDDDELWCAMYIWAAKPNPAWL